MALSSSISSSVASVKNPIGAADHHEGEITKRVEEQTAKIPSLGYLGLAVGSMVLSAGLVIFARKKELANFVGLWAPSFMLMGIYNKLVKLEGSDRFSS
jgi:hypothetical protein